MRKITLFIFFLISFFLMSEIPVDATRGISVISDLSHESGKLGEYRALIIGINDYKDPKIPDLETAVKDARAMAELLRERYGFQVDLLLDRDATKEAIYRALRRLASSTKPNESVLIYYAGHGDLDRTYDDGWWIPVDAKGGNPITYLDNVQVQKSMRSMKARHVLLISDSCYSGTLFGQARAMPQVIDNKYYLNLYNEKSRWGMTSGNRTPVSDQGSHGHSVFAYQLLKELRNNEKPYVSTQEIYIRIAPIVGNNSEQTPVCRPVRNTGDQGGEFVFVASGDTMTDIAAAAKLAAERKRLEQERRELERIKAEIEERKRLEVERQILEAERRQIEEENQKTAKTELAAIDTKKEHEEEKSELIVTIQPHPKRGMGILPAQVYLRKKARLNYSKDGEWINRGKTPFKTKIDPGLYDIKIIGYHLGWERTYSKEIHIESGKRVSIEAELDNEVDGYSNRAKITVSDL